MLHAMGHPNVSVLDGGFPKWAKEGRACTSTSDSADGFGYKLDTDKIKLLQQVKDFNANLAERNYQFLDVRAPDQFAAGNVEGSTNFPTGKIMDMESKCMKSKEDRIAAFTAAGVDLDKPITLSCGAGVAASVVYMALHDIATAKVSVYDGSWSEYAKNK